MPKNVCYTLQITIYKLPSREDERDTEEPVSTFSLFAKGSKLVSSVIL